MFEHEIPADRPADAHDVLGTYRLVANCEEMRRLPRDFEDFLGLLRRRHATILESRPDRLPGEFKREPNQAGATLFVAPTSFPARCGRGSGCTRRLPNPSPERCL